METHQAEVVELIRGTVCGRESVVSILQNKSLPDGKQFGLTQSILENGIMRDRTNPGWHSGFASLGEARAEATLWLDE